MSIKRPQYIFHTRQLCFSQKAHSSDYEIFTVTAIVSPFWAFPPNVRLLPWEGHVVCYSV